MINLSKQNEKKTNPNFTYINHSKKVKNNSILAVRNSTNGNIEMINLSKKSTLNKNILKKLVRNSTNGNTETIRLSENNNDDNEEHKPVKKSIINHMKNKVGYLGQVASTYLKEKSPELKKSALIVASYVGEKTMDLVKLGLNKAKKIKNSIKTLNENNIKKLEKNEEKYIYDITKSYYIQLNSNNKNDFIKAITGLKETPNYKKILSVFENDFYILIYKHIQEKYVFLYINYNGKDVFVKYNQETKNYNANNIPDNLQKYLKIHSYLN